MVSKDFAADLAEQEAANGRARAHANCMAINTATEKLRGVVIAATALRARSTTDGAAALRAQLLAGLDLRDCDADYPLTPKEP